MFDALRYVAGYPDLIAAIGADEAAARAHYDAHGRAEGRDPFKFDPLAYAASNGDLIRAFGSDTRALSLHYIRHGFGEHRKISFDALAYGASHNDLMRIFGADSAALTLHYVRHGFAEGRSISFDALAYGASHADLIRAYGDNRALLTEHYVRHGFAEGRAISFDALAYGASHADLIRAYGDNRAALTEHYVRHGFAEGRGVSFDPLAYGASHPDLIRTFGDDAAALARHYIQHGAAEGRGSSFTAAGYAAANSDLEAQFGADGKALALHFIRTGFAEGRLVATIVGTANADQLTGTAARDILAGRGGDDLFFASGGSDHYLGGIGADTIDYSAIGAAVVVEAGAPAGWVARHGVAGDTLVSIERLILGAGDDRVLLDGSSSIVFGGAGNDVLHGRGGGDELHGGDGNDSIGNFVFDGSLPNGIDRMYGDAGDDFIILGAVGGIADGGTGNDFFTLRELAAGKSAQIDGGAGNDSVSSSLVANTLIKANGAIVLTDRVTGDVRATLTGVETLSFLATAPFGIVDGVLGIRGEGGPGIFYVGSGNHDISGAFSTTGTGATPGFQLDRGRQTIDVTFLGTGNAFFNTSDSQIAAVVRGDVNVEFSVSADSNIVLGNGADRIVVRGGVSVVDGGGGNDSLWLLSAAATTVDMMRGTAVAGQGLSVSFSRIENVFTSDGDDVIIGNDEVNVLRGLAGNDRIYGGGSGSDGRFDILIGWEGNDLLVGGGGYDSLRGESGDDLLVDRANGSFSGDDGNDKIVVLLDDPATSSNNVAYINTDAGADTVIVSALVGTYGFLRFSNFNAGEGDKIDLSGLRDAGGSLVDLADVQAAASASADGLRIDLGHFRSPEGAALSGALLITSMADPAALSASMFVFEGGLDWRPLVPADWIL